MAVTRGVLTLAAITITGLSPQVPLADPPEPTVDGATHSFRLGAESSEPPGVEQAPSSASRGASASRPTNLERAQSLDCTPDGLSLALGMVIGGTAPFFEPCRPPGACDTSDDAETTTRLEIALGAPMPGTGCTTTQAATATVTPSLVQTAFREVRIPHTTITIEPPGGTTLVNLDTNFHTNAKPFQRHLTLLGRNVDLHITPTTYTWNFGDGTTRTTTHPGTPYPDLTNTHRYHHTGTHTTTLTTTWNARYRVDNGPWTPVTTTVDTTSTPVDLRVRQATPIRTD